MIFIENNNSSGKHSVSGEKLTKKKSILESEISKSVDIAREKALYYDDNISEIDSIP